jgi:peroxiredoxin 2/4
MKAAKVKETRKMMLIWYKADICHTDSGMDLRYLSLSGIEHYVEPLKLIPMKPRLFNPYAILPRIGHPAPDFEVSSNRGMVKLSAYKGKWLILFSYPADFTPVCTTELKAFARLYPALRELNCELVGVSVDSVAEHRNWVKSLEEEGNLPIAFPILADLNLEVSNSYGLLPNENAEEASRSVYVIDPAQTIRAIIHYPATTGRNTAELLRLLKALQTADTQKAMTPADWQPGDELIYPEAYFTHKPCS